jgi:hypothetical protein
MPNLLFSSTNPNLIKNDRIDFSDHIIYNNTDYEKIDTI